MVDPESVRVHNLAVGQVAEWLVWTQLVASSGGDLHVFLPLKDEGIDGIVHRLSTDQYTPVQVKGRERHHGGIEVQVAAHELVDDRASLVAVETKLGPTGLGAYCLVVAVPAFRELAGQLVSEKRLVYFAHIPLPPTPNSNWWRWSVPLQDIGNRLLPTATVRPAALPLPAMPFGWVAAGQLGFRGEMELLRRAADSDRLNIFKAFPDLEPNEYVMYDLVSRGLVGIQVKSVTVQSSDDEATLSVYRPALRPSLHTWFVLFLADEGQTTFLDYCAVMPSSYVAEHLSGRGFDGKLTVTRRLGGRLAPWRVDLANLGSRLTELAAAAVE